MAKTCSVCGSQIGFMSGNRGMCQDCFLKSLKADTAETSAALAQERTEAENRQKAVSQVLLTTEVVSDLKIIERIEIVSAEVAFGMNIFKDLFAGVRDIVGGRSEAVQKTLRDARRTALHELKTEAYDVGANAVVGVDLDYVELSGNGNMVMLVASGTAVVIEKK